MADMLRFTGKAAAGESTRIECTGFLNSASSYAEIFIQDCHYCSIERVVAGAISQSPALSRQPVLQNILAPVAQL